MRHDHKGPSSPEVLHFNHSVYPIPHSDSTSSLQAPIADSLSSQVIAEKNESSRRQLYRDRVICKVRDLDVPCKDHFEQLIGYKYRTNRKTNTIRNYYTSIHLFLTFLKSRDKNRPEQIERSDIEQFVEHEQDRQIQASTMRIRLACIYAFLRFLIQNNLADSGLLERKIHIKLPKALPRSMSADDEHRFISVIDHVRDRAMILLLLRTGMRIGELLNAEMNHINLEDQMIRINESEKTGEGRVVYFSNDAAEALYHWLLERDIRKKRLFYAYRSNSMSYTAARKVFIKYMDKAGLSQKGYSLHCLRHSYATGLLNAGMPIGCLRDLLGHMNLKQTLRYAQLSDNTRKEEFFRAMTIIEGGKTNEPDRFDY